MVAAGLAAGLGCGGLVLVVLLAVMAGAVLD